MATNERWYGELETRVRTLEHEVARLREWRHNVPSELIAPIQEQIVDVLHAVRSIPAEVKRQHPPVAVNPERDLWDRLSRYGVVYAAGIGTMVALGKILHWF